MLSGSRKVAMVKVIEGPLDSCYVLVSIGTTAGSVRTAQRGLLFP